MLVYATRDVDGESVLVAIRCDNCGAEVKPSPEITKSGWVKVGRYAGPGCHNHTCAYCPECDWQRMSR